MSVVSLTHAQPVAEELKRVLTKSIYKDTVNGQDCIGQGCEPRESRERLGCSRAYSVSCHVSAKNVNYNTV